MDSPLKDVEVLCVEDSAGDRRLIAEFFARQKNECHLNFVRDGVEAMDYLRQNGEFADRPRPALILLDLNLPRKDGREVLKEIKESEAFKRIPILVFSSSSSTDDIIKSYELHANCYLVKPMDVEEFQIIMDKIEDFWLCTAALAARRDCA